MRARKLKLLMVCIGLGAGTMLGTGIARADGVINDTEFAYVAAYGPSAICPVIDDFPTAPGVFGVMQGIMDDGFSDDSAVDIINAAVANFCPRHWPLLQRIGEQARARSIESWQI